MPSLCAEVCRNVVFKGEKYLAIQQRVFMWRHIKQILQVILLATAMLVSSHHGPDIEKYNQISQNFLFTSYHNTKLQLSDKNISTHIQVKFKILLWSESKVIAYFVVFLNTALYKRKPRSGAKSYACKCLPRRANPLFRMQNGYCVLGNGILLVKNAVVVWKWRWDPEILLSLFSQQFF